jgi:hypothetical protein
MHCGKGKGCDPRRGVVDVTARPDTLTGAVTATRNLATPTSDWLGVRMWRYIYSHRGRRASHLKTLHSSPAASRQYWPDFFFLAEQAREIYLT